MKKTEQELRLRNASSKNESGVDVTLIDWMLQHTPVERLEILQQQVAAIPELRNAKAT